MKKKLIVFFATFILLIYTSMLIKPNNVYANNLELVGKNIGLVVVPSDNRLFDINNLNPGDNITSSLKIRNEYNYPFTLSMKTERMSGGNEENEIDIYKKLFLTIYYKNEKIYAGPMNGFGNDSILLGKFSPGAEEEIVATVNLPGSETGNEYQGKSVNVKWIFIAQSSGSDTHDDDDDVPDKNIPDEDVPEEDTDIPDEDVTEEYIDIPDNEVPKGDINIEMPKTGEVNPFIYYSIGSILILSGAVCVLKKKKD